MLEQIGYGRKIVSKGFINPRQSAASLAKRALRTHLASEAPGIKSHLSEDVGSSLDSVPFFSVWAIVRHPYKRTLEGRLIWRTTHVDTKATTTMARTTTFFLMLLLS